jgi:hypothetical protein
MGELDLAKHFALTTDELAKASSALAAAGRANLAAGEAFASRET